MLFNNVNAQRGGALTVDGRATDVSESVGAVISTDIETDFANGTALYNVIDGIQAAYQSFQGSQAGFLSYLKTLAQAMLRNMATLDQGGNLNSLMSLSASLQLLSTQMINASASFKANVPALGSQTNVGSPTGNPTVVGTVKSGTGLYSGQELSLAETITFTVTKDSYSGGATAYQESVTAAGIPAQSDKTSWDWPKGSGKSATFTIIDPSLNNSGGTLLQNGSMDTWTNSNVPDNFTYLVGTAGTDAQRGATTFASSSYSFQFIGGTSVQTAITQTFNTTPATGIGAGGTSFNMGTIPRVPLIFCMQLKCDVVPAAGVITVDLVDGTNTVINDDAGTANSFTVTLSGVTTSFVAKTGVFRLPASVPSTVKLRIRASTAISAGTNCFIDDIALAKAVPLYGGSAVTSGSGPAFAIFRGATKPVVNDAWTMALTISAAGAFQRVMQKLFDVDTLGIYFPTKADASETVADTLIA